MKHLEHKKVCDVRHTRIIRTSFAVRAYQPMPWPWHSHHHHHHALSNDYSKQRCIFCLVSCRMLGLHMMHLHSTLPLLTITETHLIVTQSSLLNSGLQLLIPQWKVNTYKYCCKATPVYRVSLTITAPILHSSVTVQHRSYLPSLVSAIFIVPQPAETSSTVSTIARARSKNMARYAMCVEFWGGRVGRDSWMLQARATHAHHLISCTLCLSKCYFVRLKGLATRICRLHCLHMPCM